MRNALLIDGEAEGDLPLARRRCFMAGGVEHT